MHGVLDDLGMRYAGFYSANMNDLMDARERERLLAFADDFTAAIASDETVPRLHQPLPYVPAPLPAAAAPGSTRAATRGRRIVVVTDARPGEDRLIAMIERLRSAFDGPTELVNLHDVDIREGCLGCLAAGSSTAAPTRARTGSPSLARTCSGRTSWCSRGPS